MRTREAFKKGQRVEIANYENKYFKNEAIVLEYDEQNKIYRVNVMENGRVVAKNEAIKSWELIKVLTPSEDQKIMEGHLESLIDFAIQINDKKWFKSLAKKRNKLSSI